MPEDILKHFKNIEKRNEDIWAESPSSPIIIAKAFKKIGARLINISAYLAPDGKEITIFYHFAHDGRVFNIKHKTKDFPGASPMPKDRSSDQNIGAVGAPTNRRRIIDSITSIYPASDWLEKEAGEMYDVRFINHKNQTNLLLTPSMKIPLLKIEKEKRGIK